MNKQLSYLLEDLPPAKVRYDEPLAKYTTVKIGGPADILFEPTSTDELIDAVKSARKHKVPVTMLGLGANVLVSDKGIRGLVIRSKCSNIEIDESGFEASENGELRTDRGEVVTPKSGIRNPELRHDVTDESEGGRKMYEFTDLDYDESDSPRITVTMDSGVNLSFAINQLIAQGITGLQWYSRIPASIGGAIYNNVHGGTHFIGEVVKSVRVLDENHKTQIINQEDLEFDYDYSRFHHTDEVILDVTFELYRGDKVRARAASIEWAKRKAVQPSKSTGCVFANISNEDKEKLAYPTGSVGYIVEHVLEMTGFHIGDAYISPEHHNFIENKGKATAQDYLAVMKEIHSRFKNLTGISLTPEIFFLGFAQADIKELYA